MTEGLGHSQQLSHLLTFGPCYVGEGAIAKTNESVITRPVSLLLLLSALRRTRPVNLYNHNGKKKRNGRFIRDILFPVYCPHENRVEFGRTRIYNTRHVMDVIITAATPNGKKRKTKSSHQYSRAAILHKCG